MDFHAIWYWRIFTRTCRATPIFTEIGKFYNSLAWRLTCISVHNSTLSRDSFVAAKICVAYSEIYFVFWATPYVLKYILCSELHLMFWNTFCVPNYTLCSEIHFVFWTTPYVLKHILCSEINLMFWSTPYVLKYILCSELNLMFWNTFCVLN